MVRQFRSSLKTNNAHSMSACAVPVLKRFYLLYSVKVYAIILSPNTFGTYNVPMCILCMFECTAILLNILRLSRKKGTSDSYIQLLVILDQTMHLHLKDI